MILLILTLYIYIFNTHKKLLISTFFFFFIKLELEFYIYIIILLIIYLFIVNLLLKYIKKILMKFNKDIYFKSYFDILKSYILIFIFTVYYFVYLRLVILIADRKIDLNIFLLKKKILDFSMQYKCAFCILTVIFLLFMLIYLILFIINYVIFFFYKKHFLKIHYYKFLRSKNLLAFIKYIFFLEKLLSNKLNTKYQIFIYFREYLPKIIILFYLIFNIIYNNGEIGTVVKIFPYYSLYFFFFNIYSYIISSFNHDFDILITEHYYKKINFFMEKNELKKKEYIKNLFFGNSKFKFEDSIYYDFELKDQIENNFLLIQTYKYSHNKPPNDFFTIIRKIDPEL